MRKINAKDLHIKIIDILNQCEEYAYISGKGPFFFTWKAKQMCIYVKNVSSAYFTNKDITRVQLARRGYFEPIKVSDVVFILMGYDSLNNVFVTWSPSLVKSRLNSKRNVSFYSRLSVQEKANVSCSIQVGYLTNATKFISGSLSTLPKFLSNIEDYFPVVDKFGEAFYKYCVEVCKEYGHSRLKIVERVQRVLCRFPEYTPCEVANFIETHMK